MSQTQDVFGAAKQTVLNKPFAQFQEKQQQGVAGSTVAAGDNIIPLNAAIINEIPGVSLAGSSVELPAGTYRIEAEVYRHLNAIIGRLHIDTLGGARLLTGINGTGINGDSPFNYRVGGQIKIDQTENIVLNFYSNTAGQANPINQPPAEVYADIRIVKQDAVEHKSVNVTPGLYPLPSGAMVTGNIVGLELEYVDASQIKVLPGACLDSLNETALMLSEEKFITIAANPSTIYNVFLTDDPALPVKIDTDVNGVNLPAGDKRRYIGFVITWIENSDIKAFKQSGDLVHLVEPLFLHTQRERRVWHDYDLSQVLPISRTWSQIVNSMADVSGTTGVNYVDAISATPVLQYLPGVANYSTSNPLEVIGGLIKYYSYSYDPRLFLTGWRIKR